MASKITKTIWVNSTSLSEIDGQCYIPTALCYLNDDLLIGNKATDLQSNKKIVNKNFKIDLGDILPGSSDRKLFSTESKGSKSAFEITKDFFEKALFLTQEHHEPPLSEEHKIKAKIIVAEPLSLHVSERSTTWLSNYRGNIRRILSNYEEVDFLPEPFAVYQYYRYGVKIPHLQDKSKHIALIIDFGGGTFDSSIIESTHDGDVSQSSAHSKPLSAHSIAVGGFVINREIAIYLLKRDIEGNEKRKIDQFLDFYNRVNSGNLQFDNLSTDKQNFISNFRRLEDSVESAKIELVNKIVNWGLKQEDDKYKKVTILVPKDPFSCSDWIEKEFAAHHFRNLFTEKIWNKSLKSSVKETLDRAKQPLKGKKISITLISGGSSNIRWLQELLIQDFHDELSQAEPVPINHSFQEVVAKGLAIECARRFYNEDSEFVSVTYNPIKLLLNPDEYGIENNTKFHSISESIDMHDAQVCDLIPSAQALKNFIDVPLLWKFKVTHPPRNRLDYYFTPQADDYETECFNIGSTTLHTESGTNFDSQLKVELIVREDGTVTPKFIYKSKNVEFKVEECSRIGKSFPIDMTSISQNKKSVSHYIGFDFGTSTSSICRLTQNDFRMLSLREGDNNCLSLADSLRSLPYPIAYAVRKYLDVKNNNESGSYAREAFESCLTFMAYVAFAELISKRKAGGQFKSFQHRSMGPLKALLVSSLNALGESAHFSYDYKIFIKEDLAELDEAIEYFNDHKHDKADFNDAKARAYVNRLVNVVANSMNNRIFGFCLDSVPEPFQRNLYKGQFKAAHDVQPFAGRYSYESKVQVSNTSAILVDTEKQLAIDLSPLIFWMERVEESAMYCCYLFDKYSSGEVIFKLADRKSIVEAGNVNGHLSDHLNRFVTGCADSDVMDFVTLEYK